MAVRRAAGEEVRTQLSDPEGGRQQAVFPTDAAWLNPAGAEYFRRGAVDAAWGGRRLGMTEAPPTPRRRVRGQLDGSAGRPAVQRGLPEEPDQSGGGGPG